MAVRAAEARATPAPIRVPALASTAVREILTGGSSPGIVLGMSTHASWLLVGSDVIVVTTRDATRLPNGIELPMDASSRILQDVHHAAPVIVDSGRIVFDGLVVEAARWWDPKPAIGRLHPAALAAAIEGLPATVPYVDEQPLRAALVERSSDALVSAGEVLIGRGPGLTPESDDYLAGVVAATRIFGEAIENEAATAMLDAASGPLEGTASTRTTALSAALLRCALRGNVAEPASRLIRALAGRGSITDGHKALRRVGDTSGPALAAGVVLGVRALVAQ
ncbi:MAG: DUF2877 domain-containing protein [Actinomycetota bacterium]